MLESFPDILILILVVVYIHQKLSCRKLSLNVVSFYHLWLSASVPALLPLPLPSAVATARLMAFFTSTPTRPLLLASVTRRATGLLMRPLVSKTFDTCMMMMVMMKSNEHQVTRAKTKRRGRYKKRKTIQRLTRSILETQSQCGNPLLEFMF